MGLILYSLVSQIVLLLEKTFFFLGIPLIQQYSSLSSKVCLTQKSMKIPQEYFLLSIVLKKVDDFSDFSVVPLSFKDIFFL